MGIQNHQLALTIYLLHFPQFLYIYVPPYFYLSTPVSNIHPPHPAPHPANSSTVTSFSSTPYLPNTLHRSTSTQASKCLHMGTPSPNAKPPNPHSSIISPASSPLPCRNLLNVVGSRTREGDVGEDESVGNAEKAKAGHEQFQDKGRTS